VSNGTSTVTVIISDTVGDLLPNASYDCCVSANYAWLSSTVTTTEIRCASIRSEDLLTATNRIIISDICADMKATVTVLGAVLGCIIVVLLALVCGGTLFHLLRSRTSGEVPKR
jgi:hypothetical protein